MTTPYNAAERDLPEDSEILELTDGENHWNTSPRANSTSRWR